MMSVFKSMRLRARSTATSQHAGSVEKMLWVVGFLGVFYCVICIVQMQRARQAADRFFRDPTSQSASATLTEMAFETVQGPAKLPAVVGRVEIPAIGLVTPLLAGDDAMSLTQGAGHIPGTALPGGLGTVGIAGHRDTHFRLLSKVTPGMDVRLVSRSGVYHYRVTSSEIVSPEQVSVLAIGSVPSLSLVTCYPFSFIGHAPKRFIVHAALVSAAPDV